MTPVQQCPHQQAIIISFIKDLCYKCVLCHAYVPNNAKGALHLLESNTQVAQVK